MDLLRQSILIGLRVFGAAGAITIGSAAQALAGGTLTLTWDANPEPDVAGYIVFYGVQSGQYGTSVDVGPQTSFQLAGLDLAAPYYFAVRAYNQSRLESPLSQEVSTAGSLLTISSLVSSLRAPQPAGASITFNVSSSGGVAPAQYKWLVYDGATWRTEKDWSTSNSFVWTPAQVNPSYHVQVWARSAGKSTDAPETPAASASMAFPIVASLSVTNLLSDLPSPQHLGGNIEFTAAASGGLAPHEFKWLIFDGARWTTARNWSPANTFMWTPTAAGPDFKVGVWVRSAMSTIDAPEGSSAGTSLPFTITANTDLRITRLKADKPSPQPLGAKVTFAATASGAKKYSYKWWVFNGKKWTVAKEWSSSSKFVWKPGTANAGYQILVRVRDSTNPKRTSAGTAMAFPIAKRRR